MSRSPAVAGAGTESEEDPIQAAGRVRGNAAPVAQRLVAALDDAGIRYCHWKGDPRGIDAALSGTSDLDLLIDPAHAEAAAATLAACGFKHFTATPWLRHPGVEDYLALDADTSRLLHCHVHYRLVVGEPHVKGFRLPWEERFLATRRRTSGSALYVPDPALELVFLWTRSVTRLRARDIAAPLLGRPWLPASTASEDAWLRPRIENTAATALCTELLGARATRAFIRLLAGRPSLRNAFAFRRAVRPALGPYRQYGALAGRVRGWCRELAAAVARLDRRRLRIALPLRRARPGGGVLVAFLGCDGAGKSTITRTVAALLAPKIDVLLVYFGSGDGPGSLLRWPLSATRRAAARLGLLAPTDGATRFASRPGRRDGVLRSLALGLWALTLAIEKRRKLRTAWRARSRGLLVLADRYPQAQLPGFNDGPLLGHLATRRNAVLRALARFEGEPYRRAARQVPDVVVKLRVTAETAGARKPDTAAEAIDSRVRAIDALAFPGSTVVEVDANRPLTQVLKDVERVVWRSL